MAVSLLSNFRLRKALPEASTLIVVKNKLMGKAIEGTKWEALKPAHKGMNAWLFEHSDEIPAALKPYRNFRQELNVENYFTGSVFEGKLYAPDQCKELEPMPSLRRKRVKDLRSKSQTI